MEPPLYAGPNPFKAPGCEASNPLSLEADSAKAATLMGCYEDTKESPALGNGGFWFSNTKMEAEVGRYYISYCFRLVCKSQFRELSETRVRRGLCSHWRDVGVKYIGEIVLGILLF